MPDRDNVINHFQDAIEASGNDNKWRFVRVDIIEDALELLKEQEPVEPKVEIGPVTASKVYRCGNCETHFYYRRQKYCAICGRKVKWDG